MTDPAISPLEHTACISDKNTTCFFLKPKASSLSSKPVVWPSLKATCAHVHKRFNADG